MSLTDATLDPDLLQRRAADRTRSIWVAASAGTGKTTVLTNRVLNLLLGGAEPHRLLCLTFTKAAAAEMANRINRRLSQWAVMPVTELRQDILKLTGKPPDEATADAARRLFARVLNTPGGMQILTIHAFCQSVLRRFPLEAQIPPNFELMDDRTAAELRLEVTNRILNDVREGKHAGAIRQCLDIITQRLDESRFGDLVVALTGARGRLEAWIEEAGGLEAYIRHLWSALGFEGPRHEVDLIRDAARDRMFEHAALIRVVEALAASPNKTDRNAAETLSTWLATNEDERPPLWNKHLSVFLTQDFEPRARLLTERLARAEPWIHAILAREGARIAAVRQCCAAANLGHATEAATRLAARFFSEYAQEKQLRALVDYDDLILATRSLLSRPGVAPWVLFKLDGGIDHILVDEAQDTNPAQWQIVQMLADEFFAGASAQDRSRTVFAVGDAKQSIFSFQGADPLKFIDMQDYFACRAREADQGFETVPLTISFRSTEAILGLVDKVFADHGASDGVMLDGQPIRHDVFRKEMAGRVELWPPLTPPPPPEEAPWSLPIAQTSLAHPRAELADLIAATIADWIRSGEILEARGRPIRASDILVLVRRRNEFVTELIRALKKRSVPVAGADRIVLHRQIAVMDLIALGQFLILPEDDLTLATVLKSPFFGFTDDDLLPLAAERRGATLWRRLRDAAAQGDVFAARAETELGHLLARADYVAPYELYAQLLGAEGGRTRLLARLGPEASDGIEEFLAQALDYERTHVPSLQGFLHWLVSGDTEVKRDPESGERDEVRIMTVHGAKGLQAPIVIMPDTISAPTRLPPLQWLDTQRLMLWIPKDGMGAELAETARQAAKQARDQEYRRLLYVALTRAEDRLYICGWQGTKEPARDCWYNLIEAQMLEAPEHPILVPPGFAQFHRPGRSIVTQQTKEMETPARVTATLALATLPSWARALPPQEPSPPRPLIASRPTEQEPPARSPLIAREKHRFQRGLIIHRLLQTLPDLPDPDREAAANRYLASPAHGLEPYERDLLRQEIMAVLRHPDWTDLFGPNSQAEVAVAGLIGQRVLSGRIDRIVVRETEVLAIDYKTNRPPPRHASDVPAAYVEQMMAYRAALERIYPAKAIRTLLLWTDDLRLMEIADPAGSDGAR